MNHKTTNISIIIRFNNESKYLTNVFEAILKQNIELPIEIISVNNNSTDNSRSIAEKYSDLIIDMKQYEPGKALNAAIEKSNGSIIVILSAHTIPGNRSWLKNLISPFIVKNKNEELIATYGAQIYPYYSQFLDKRDLDIFNFASCRYEYHDTDFWNANSAFQRKTWESNKFCENVYELEDHFWTKEILSKQKGCVYFNPVAYVYHYGHDKRVDRKYPNIQFDQHSDYIKTAQKILSIPSHWYEVMWAALICNSVSSDLITDEIIDLLGKHLVHHWDFDVRWRIAQTLGNIPGEKSISYLANTLADTSFYPRNEAAWSLRKLLPNSISQVSKTFISSSGEEKLYAAFVMGASNNELSQHESFSYLINMLKNDDELEVLRSLYIIGEIAISPNSLKAVKQIKEIIEAKVVSDKTIAIAIWCLGRIYESQDYDFPLNQIINICKEHNNYLVRYEAINALSRFLIKTPVLNVIEEFHNRLVLEIDDRVKYAICQTMRLFSEKNKSIFNLDKEEIIKLDDFGAIYECNLIQINMENK